LCIFFVTLKKSGDPWITLQPVLIPRLFMSSVSEDKSSATPPP